MITAASYYNSLEIVVFFFYLRLNRDGNISVFLVYIFEPCVCTYVLYIRNCVSLNKYRIRNNKKTNQLELYSVGRVKMIKKFWHKEAFLLFFDISRRYKVIREKIIKKEIVIAWS